MAAMLNSSCGRSLGLIPLSLPSSSLLLPSLLLWPSLLVLSLLVLSHSRLGSHSCLRVSFSFLSRISLSSSLSSSLFLFLVLPLLLVLSHLCSRLCFCSSRLSSLSSHPSSSSSSSHLSSSVVSPLPLSPSFPLFFVSLLPPFIFSVLLQFVSMPFWPSSPSLGLLLDSPPRRCHVPLPVMLSLIHQGWVCLLPHFMWVVRCSLSSSSAGWQSLLQWSLSGRGGAQVDGCWE